MAARMDAMLSRMEASVQKGMDKLKEKAAEVRAQVDEHRAVGTAQQQQQRQQHLPAAAAAGHGAASSSSSHQGELPADSRALSLHACGFEISGVSIAGQETCLILPRAKVALDIGRCPQQAVAQQTVLITHGHLDHIGGVAFHAASRMLLGLPPPRYVVLPALEPKLRALLQAANDLDGGTPLEYEVTPLQEGQELELPSGFLVRPFPTVHPVPSQGYILYSMRKKLRPELLGRSQEDIKAMRLAGEEVTEISQVPELAFTGDTSGELFERDAGCADMYRAKLLVVECTFVDDSVSWEQARERGHIHVTDLVMHAHKFANEAILLVHFSPRYKRAEILAALDTNLPASLRAKCIPFLNGFA